MSKPTFSSPCVRALNKGDSISIVLPSLVAVRFSFQSALIFGFQLSMQTVASKSPLDWPLVHKIEGSKVDHHAKKCGLGSILCYTQDFDPTVIDLNKDDVRKAEKDLMAYNSESFVGNPSLVLHRFQVFSFVYVVLTSVFLLIVPFRGHSFGDGGSGYQRPWQSSRVVVSRRHLQEEEAGGHAEGEGFCQLWT